jgi:hypothetical protein
MMVVSGSSPLHAHAHGPCPGARIAPEHQNLARFTLPGAYSLTLPGFRDTNLLLLVWEPSDEGFSLAREA